MPGSIHRAASHRPSLFLPTLLVCASALHAQHDVKKLIVRLGEEAETFRASAPGVIGEEILKQRSQKQAPKMKLRIGDAARQPLQGQWQQRTVVSEYAFGTFGKTFHELRQVVTVDGKKVGERKEAQDALARIILADNQDRKREILKQFEEYGLVGSAADFGQLLLLFNPVDILHYEFTPHGIAALGDVGVYIFQFRQLDGDEGFTLVDAKNVSKKEKKKGKTGDAPEQVRMEGTIWVRAEDYAPLRIVVAATTGEGDKTVREEADISYKRTGFETLMPTSVHHVEVRAGRLTAENLFTYAEFHKFAASSEIKFEVEDDPRRQ